MIFKCCDERRKAAVLGNTTLNGIDFLEVLDLDAIPLNSPRQRTLLVHCLKLVPPNLTPSNVLIIGGESITNIVIQWIAPASAPPPLGTPQENAFFTALADAPNTLVIRTEETGDFSPYALRLVNDAAQAKEDPFAVTEVLAGFDPQLAEVRFSFKVECPSDLDCAPPKRSLLIACSSSVSKVVVMKRSKSEIWASWRSASGGAKFASRSTLRSLV